MKTLKVHIFSTYYAPETTGNAPYVTRLAEGLVSRGHCVRVTCGVPHYPEWRIRPRSEWSDRENRQGVDVSRAKSYVPRKPNFANRIIYEVGFGFKLARELKRPADVRVLVSPSLFGSIIVRLGGLLVGSRTPVVLWVQDLYSFGVRETPGLAGRLIGWLVTRAESWLARSVDRVIVIHDRFKVAMAESLGLDPHHVSVIRNWSHATPAARSRSDARAHMDWPEDAVVVVHAGNQGAKQGLAHVVEACRHASLQRLPLLFLMVGDGNQRERLEALSKGLKTVRFIDPLPDEDFMELLAAADALLVNERPSLKEAAVPSKLTTYFATGRPVLAATDSDSATAGEIRASGAGVVVSPNDPVGLCDAALELASELAPGVGANGPDYVRAMLSEQAALVAFESILTKHVIETKEARGVEHSADPKERATT